MNSLAVALLVVGVVLALLLTLVVFTFWKYIQTKKKIIEKDVKDGKKAKNKKKARNSVNISDFEVPISYRTVNAQMPFVLEGGSHKSAPKDTKYTKTGHMQIDDLKTKPRSYSHALEEKESMLASSLPDRIFRENVLTTTFGVKQKKISQGMIDHLSKQGKNVDHRSASITDDMFSMTSNNDGLNLSTHSLRDDDTISVHSFGSRDEYFSSTTLNIQKRRMGDRRALRPKVSDSGSGYVVPQRRTYKRAGKINFTIQYVENQRSFEVHLLRAFDIAPRRDVAEISSFVRVYLLPGKKQKQDTQTAKCSKEPFFNEEVVFSDIGSDEFKKYKLKLKVYNRTRLKKNELLGEVDIPLASIDLNARETFNIDLLLQRSESSLASVCISICHQATFSKLEVIITEARHIPKIGVSGTPNPYVTVSFYKEQSIERRETATKRNTRDPSFKESIEFDIQTDSRTPLSTYSLVVTLNHHSLVGKDEVLGHVIFSLNSPQRKAAEHWKAVQDTPHKHHMNWHTLIDPDEL